MSPKDEAQKILNLVSNFMSQGPAKTVYHRSYREALKRLGVPPEKPADSKSVEIVSDLNSAGYWVMGSVMDGVTVDECVASLDNGAYDGLKRTGEVFNDRDDAIDAGIGELRYDDPTVYQIDALLRAANHPTVLKAVSQYLGVVPTIQHILCTRSLANADQSHEPFTIQSKISPKELGQHQLANQFFHADYAGVRFLKLLIYLTDVDSENGPHEFVLGTHDQNYVSSITDKVFGQNPDLRKAWKKQYRKTEVLMNEVFPPEDVVVLTGQKGFAFIEDTSGFHRGKPPSKRDRVMCQVLYTMHDDMQGREPHPENRNKTVLPDLLNQLSGHFSDPEVRYINRMVVDVS